MAMKFSLFVYNLIISGFEIQVTEWKYSIPVTRYDLLNVEQQSILCAHMPSWLLQAQSQLSSISCWLGIKKVIYLACIAANVYSFNQVGSTC